MPDRTRGRGQPLISTTSPACSFQRSKLPERASIAKAERQTSRETRRGAEAAQVQDDARAVAERDVDREAHAERVHLAARPQHERALEVVAAREPTRALTAGPGHLGDRQHVVVANQPGHARSYTLNRISRTSPSRTS